MKVKEIFNGEFALYYEKVINRISSPIFVDRWRRRLVEGALSLIPSPQLVLDCCSGAGNIGEILLKRKPQTNLINCDISKPLLSMARERLREKSTYICSDNRFFPVKSSSVDIVFSSFCVRNSPEPEKTVSEVMRVLKPGKVWAILDFFKPESDNLISLFNRSFFYQFMTINKLISKSSKEAIDYLFESIENFYTVSEFCEILKKFGFSVIKVERFMGGLATNIIAVKGGRDV